MTQTKRILAVDDDLDILDYIADLLQKAGYAISKASSGEEAVLLAENEEFNLIISDMQMPGLSWGPLVERFLQVQPDTPVIALTAHGSFEEQIDLVNKGAYDVISKPGKEANILMHVARALKSNEDKIEIRELRLRLEEHHELVVGDEEVMKPLLDKVKTIADTDFPVLLTGESGTGKELVARYIHRQSPRLKRPFVAVNCPAIPNELFESEFFGHVRGAFTGAHTDREGLFEAADGGTIFLDEVSEIALENQVKLLRVLQENEVKRVGEQTVRHVDARLICATNRDLRAAVRQARFREDLYYRIHVFPIRIPRLKERPGDVLPLAQHFLERARVELGKNPKKNLSKEAKEKLMAYPWPGNVRELKNILNQAILLSTGDEIGPDDLILDEGVEVEGPAPRRRKTVSLREARDRAVREYLEELLERVGGNISRAAEQSGKHRSEIYELLTRYNISLDKFRNRPDPSFEQ